MPVTFEFRPDQSVVITTHEGLVPDAEFLSAYTSLFENPQFDPTYDLLVDLRSADSSARSTEALKAFAEFIQSRYEAVETRPRVAVVAPQNVSFGLARMYGSFSDPVQWEFRVFREISDAFEWLGLGDGHP
jgi:hypothetical protein